MNNSYLVYTAVYRDFGLWQPPAIDRKIEDQKSRGKHGKKKPKKNRTSSSRHLGQFIWIIPENNLRNPWIHGQIKVIPMKVDEWIR